MAELINTVGATSLGKQFDQIFLNNQSIKYLFISSYM